MYSATTGQRDGTTMRHQQVVKDTNLTLALASGNKGTSGDTTEERTTGMADTSYFSATSSASSTSTERTASSSHGSVHHSKRDGWGKGGLSQGARGMRSRRVTAAPTKRARLVSSRKRVGQQTVCIFSPPLLAAKAFPTLHTPTPCIHLRDVQTTSVWVLLRSWYLGLIILQGRHLPHGGNSKRGRDGFKLPRPRAARRPPPSINCKSTHSNTAQQRP